MDFNQIQELIKLMADTGLSEFKLEDKDFKLTVRSKDYFDDQRAVGETKIITVPAAMPYPQQQQQYMPPMPIQQAPVAPAAPVAASASKAPAAAPAENSSYIEITSPIVGTFYRSPSPDKEAYVKVGDMVTSSTIVCIVEAMKLFNEIESEVSGKIIKILIDDASPVEYGQPLYLVDPNA